MLLWSMQMSFVILSLRVKWADIFGVIMINWKIHLGAQMEAEQLQDSIKNNISTRQKGFV